MLHSNRMELFAGFEANGFAGGDAHFLACARIATDARLAGFDVEHAEAPQFNAVALREGTLHGFKDRLDSDLGFGLGKARTSNHRANDVQFDQAILLKTS